MWWASIKNSFLIALLVSALACQRSAPPAARLYLASSLMPLADDIERMAKDKLPIDLIFLSSSVIAKQIEQGAPCEAAILADDRWRDHLLASGFVTDQVRVVASNTLVLAGLAKAERPQDQIGSALSSPRSGIDLDSGLRGNDNLIFGSDNLISVNGITARLRQVDTAHKLIIADPDFVPLGAYTKEVLLKLGLYEKLAPYFLLTHSARQASLLLEQGAAPLAILYRTEAINDKIHVLAFIDASLHRPIEYPLLVCKKAQRDRVNAVETIIFSQSFKEALAAKGFGKAP